MKVWTMNRLIGHEFNNSIHSISRNKTFSAVIILVLTVAMTFPSASLMNAYYNYKDRKSSYYQGNDYYMLNLGKSQLSWTEARNLNRDLKDIDGVYGLGYEGNTALQVFANNSVEELFIRWANQDLLTFEGVDPNKQQVLEANTNKVYITPYTAEKLLPGINPKGQTLEILGKSFVIEGVYNEKSVHFDTFLDTNKIFIDHEFPEINSAVIRFQSYSQAAYDQVLAVLRAYNLDSQLSSYNDLKKKELRQAYKSFMIAAALCLVLWLFSLVNIISLLVYKFERDHMKWSMLFIFGGSKSSVYRQIYMELSFYTICAYLLMLPILYAIKIVLEKVHIPMEMTLPVASLIFVFAVLTAIIFGYVWIRKIDVRNLQREINSH